jgi:serine/threonine-protein kinase
LSQKRYNRRLVFPDEVGTPVRQGDIVGAKYRIERELGRGGMGVVMAARHLGLDEPVALKFVLDRGGDDAEAVERLMREARATFRLRSPHAVRVHDVGRIPSGLVYIVMELLQGRDLRAELTARGPLPEQEVVQYAIDVCSALDEAHAAGIVHRDLKPHNLFLTRAHTGKTIVKVLDFGLSKLDEVLFEAGPLTRPATALGTPRYMAPEQWTAASEVDLRADLWGAGTVMYELLTGNAPLHGMPWQERRARLAAGAIPSPKQIRPDVSEALARVVMKCLRSDPARRWSSAAGLAEALRQAVPAPAPPPRTFGQTEITAPPASPSDLNEGPETIRTDPPPFEELGATEVRAPLFSSEDLSPPQARLERPVLGTLRSEGFPVDMEERIAGARRQAAAAKAAQVAAAPPAPSPSAPPQRASDPLARGGIWRPPQTPVPPPHAPAGQASFPPVTADQGSQLVPVLLVIVGVAATTGGLVWIFLRVLGH